MKRSKKLMGLTAVIMGGHWYDSLVAVRWTACQRRV